MKITIASSHYPPAYQSGVELVAERSARWLSSRGHDVEVVCVERIDAEQHATVEEDCRDGVPIHRLGLRLAGLDEHLGLRHKDEAVGAWFSDYFARRQPDIFHSHGGYLLTGSMIAAARRLGIPTIVSLHDYWFLCPRINLLRSDGQRCTGRATPADCAWCLMAERRRHRLIGRVAQAIGMPRAQGKTESGPLGWPLSRALLARVEERRAHLSGVLASIDHIITYAPLTRDLLVVEGLSAEKIHLVASGIDLPQGEEVPRVAAEGGLRIGYLGQLAPHKGVHLLVQAFQRLTASQRPPELHLWGDDTRFPGYVARLRRLADGNPRVRLWGAYDNAQVQRILASLDVIVVPSVWFEVRPIVILEAFAAGVPVVASRLPNLDSMITDGVDGLLFEPDEYGDLALHLQRLIDEPDLLERLRAGIRPVCTVDEEMGETMAIYETSLHAPLSPCGAGALSLEPVGDRFG